MTASYPSGKSTYSQLESVAYSSPKTPLLLACDPIAEPLVPYACSVAMQGNGNSTTIVTYGDGPAKEIQIQGYIDQSYTFAL